MEPAGGAHSPDWPGGRAASHFDGAPYGNSDVTASQLRPKALGAPDRCPPGQGGHAAVTGGLWLWRDHGGGRRLPAARSPLASARFAIGLPIRPVRPRSTVATVSRVSRPSICNRGARTRRNRRSLVRSPRAACGSGPRCSSAGRRRPPGSRPACPPRARPCRAEDVRSTGCCRNERVDAFGV